MVGVKLLPELPDRCWQQGWAFLSTHLQNKPNQVELTLLQTWQLYRACMQLHRAASDAQHKTAAACAGLP